MKHGPNQPVAMAAATAVVVVRVEAATAAAVAAVRVVRAGKLVELLTGIYAHDFLTVRIGLELTPAVGA
jgi:dihydroxyacetone kinase